MVLGIIIFDFKIGSSPFIMLRDAVSAPIFQLNHDFIHENEKAMIEEAVSVLDMTDKVSLVITESTLFVDYKG